MMDQITKLLKPIVPDYCDKENQLEYEKSLTDDSIENDYPETPSSDEAEAGGYLVLTFNSNNSSNGEINQLNSFITKPGIVPTRLTSACLSTVRGSSQDDETNSLVNKQDQFAKKRKTIQILSCTGGKSQVRVEVLNGQKVVRIVRATPVTKIPATKTELNDNLTETSIELKEDEDRTSLSTNDQPLFINSLSSMASTSSASSQIETPTAYNEMSIVDSGYDAEQDSYTTLSSFSNGPSYTRTARMLKCNECQKYYRNQYSLRHHICLKRKDVWRKGDVPTRLIDGKLVYYCPTCMKPFRWLGNLTRHFYVHTGQRFFKCEMCNKEFFSAYQVRRHMNSHTGLRFKCEICAKPFTCKYACAWHTRQHYNPDRAALLVPRR